jgi:hypothetical protein
MPLLARKTVIAAKAEGTPGTAETLTAAEAVFFAYVEPGAFTENIPILDRPSMSGGQHAAAHGGRQGSITFEVDLAGKGASGVPSWASVLLPACGGSLAVATYSFGYTVAPITLALYIDGMVRKLIGAVGTFAINLTAGQPGRVRFTFVGKIAADADATLLAPTYESVQPPRWASNAYTIGAVAVKASTLTVDLGAATKMLEDPADAAGFSYGAVTDIRPTAQTDPEAVVVATKDWYMILTGVTTSALSCAVGTAANNTITIAGTVQVVGANTGSRDNVVTRNLDLRFVWTGQTSTSPFTIAFT